MGKFCIIAKFSSEIWQKWSNKGKKWLKYIFWPSHIRNNSICNIFSFSNYSFTHLLDPVFRANFTKFGKTNGLLSTKKKETIKLKMLKMLLYIICDAHCLFTEFGVG